MKTLTRQEMATLVELVGGDVAVRMMLDRIRLHGKQTPTKYPNLTGGQTEAFFNIALKEVGEERLPDILAGRLLPTWKEVVQLLVDRHGRCISQPEVTAAVCDANKDYYFDRLPNDIDTAAMLLQWEKLFGQKADMTVDEFTSHIQAIKSKVATWPTTDKPQIANLLKGHHFPIILPQLPSGDYGTTIETFFLPIVERAYMEAFPDRKFINCRKNDLANKVNIVDKRHRQLIADLVKGPVVGIICYPLQGFSVHAQRQMASLFSDFISLMGPVEASVATALYPKSLARDVHTPIQDCFAVQWRDSGSSLCFLAHDVKLEFSYRAYLGDAYDCCSGGLFIRG